jgi:hypothetical protein
VKSVSSFGEGRGLGEAGCEILITDDFFVPMQERVSDIQQYLKVKRPFVRSERVIIMRTVALLLGFLCLGLVGLSHATTPDVSHLVVKGYSPEMIEMVQVGQSRAEWREPAPAKRSPWQGFWHNAWTGEWYAQMDEPGHRVIRRR